MRRLKNFYYNLSLEKKIVLMVSAICFCLAGGFSLLIFHIFQTRYENMLYQSTAVSSSLITQNLCAYLNDTVKLSEAIRTDSVIQQNLDIIHSGGDYIGERSYEKIYAALQDHLQRDKQNYIAYAAIISPEFTTYTYSYEYGRLSDETASVLLKSAASGKGSPVWVSDYTEEHYLFLVRQIRKIENLSLENMGTLAIIINMDTLLDTITKSSQPFQTINWLFSENGNTIYTSPELTLSEKILNSIGRDVYGTVSIDGHLYFFLQDSLAAPDWQYVQFLPYDQVASSQRTSLYLYWFLFIASQLFIILLLHLTIRRITAGIRVLYEKMKSFRGDKAAITPEPYDYATRRDEIGLLHQYFDSMATEIENLINNEYKLKLDMKNMQLKTLTSQINPHFLYNTLDSINWRAKASGNEDISLMAESLGILLRSALKVQDSLVPLEEDLDLVQHYLNIQKLRYESRLIYSFRIEESLLKLPIPPMCIQLLVENAIKYGLEENLDDCRIYIEAYTSDQKEMIVQVRNNGSAFEENLLEKLQKSEAAAEGLGLGLLNINQRIQLIYGNGYGLRLFNENDFAVAMMILPGSPQNAAGKEQLC